MMTSRQAILGRFLSGGIILRSPLSCPDLFLYTITLPAVSRDAPATLSYTTLEMASRILLSSKKPAIYQLRGPRGGGGGGGNVGQDMCTWLYSTYRLDGPTLAPYGDSQ